MNNIKNQSVIDDVDVLIEALTRQYGKVRVNQSETGSIYISGENNDGVSFVVRFSDHQFCYISSGVFISVPDDCDMVEKIIEEIEKGERSKFYISFREKRRIETEAEKEVKKYLTNVYGKLYEKYLSFLKEERDYYFSRPLTRTEARQLSNLLGIKPIFIYLLSRGVRKFDSFVNNIKKFNR